MSWHLIKSGGADEEYGFGHKEFLLDSASDIETEPTNFGVIAPASQAHTGGYGKIWEKDYSGVWQEIL